MGEQRNLTEENVAELREKLERMQKTNPDLEYRFFPQETEESLESVPPLEKEDQPSNKKLFEKLEALERKIDYGMGGLKR